MTVTTRYQPDPSSLGPPPPPAAPGAADVVVVGQGSDDTSARRCSPVSRGVAVRWIAWWAALTAVWTGLGLVVVHLLSSTTLARWDDDVPRWFERQRTPARDDWSYAASMVSDTYVKIASVALLSTVFVVVWKRWHDAWMLTGTMLLEVAAFATSSQLVGRDRPPVEQLDGSLPTSSFPSGHVAAAVAFGLALCVITWWHTERRWIRALIVAQAVLVPTAVAVARVYRGMHHPLDVLAGVLLGVASVLVMRALVQRGIDDLVANARRTGRVVPARATSLSMRYLQEEAPVVERQEHRHTQATTPDEPGSEELEERLRENPGFVTFMRVGWVAKGVVYGILGFIAFAVARGGGLPAEQDDQASPRGAVSKLAETGAGTAVLYVLAAGLAIYSLWRLISVVLPAPNDAHAWAHRIGYMVSAVMYGFLAWTAVSIAQARAGTNQDGDDDSTVSRLVADVMSHAGGRWLVGLVGLGLIAVGGFFVRKAVQRTFEDDLEHRGVGPVSYPAIVRLGVAGWLARAVIMVLIGVFLLRAGIDYDASQAAGLDDALRRTAGSTVGSWLVAVTGIGLVVYALFCFVSAPRQRLRGAD